jgi:hypothetical protein
VVGYDSFATLTALTASTALPTIFDSMDIGYRRIRVFCGLNVSCCGLNVPCFGLNVLLFISITLLAGRDENPSTDHGSVMSEGYLLQICNVCIAVLQATWGSSGTQRRLSIGGAFDRMPDAAKVVRQVGQYLTPRAKIAVYSYEYVILVSIVSIVCVGLWYYRCRMLNCWEESRACTLFFGEPVNGVF